MYRQSIVEILRRNKEKKRITLRLGKDAYRHFEESARQGNYRSVAAVISQMCECVALKGRILKEHQPQEVSEEIESMFEYFKHFEEGGGYVEG